MEKAKNDAEKVLKAQEKAGEKVRKETEKKKQEGTCSKRKRAVTRSTASSELASMSVTTTRPPAKAPCVSDDIDTEECCACFGQYSDDIGTGREWLECACGRWVHEDSVENIVHDTNGKEMLCPLCLSVI